MLDAAHGKTGGTVPRLEWANEVCEEAQIAHFGLVGSKRRGRERVPVRADVRQGSRRFVAVARSRAISNRWNGCRGECGTKVLATIAVVSCGSFEPCGPQPPPAEARKRAPQAPPRKFLRIRRSAGTDFARGNNCRIRHSAGCRFGPGIFSNLCSIQEFMRTQPSTALFQE